MTGHHPKQGLRHPPGPGCAAGGFSLVELLVVVAIIVSLSVVIVPLVRRAGDVARESVCRGNLRTCAGAVLAYARDRAGRLPVADRWFWQGAAGDYLPRRTPPLANGMDREEMPPSLLCPVAPNPVGAGPHDSEWTTYFANGSESAGLVLNDWSAIVGIGPLGGGRRLDGIADMRRCMMLGEATYLHKIVDADHPAVVDAYERAGAATLLPTCRRAFHHRANSGFFHGGGEGTRMNVAHMDMHVSSVVGREVPAYAEEASARSYGYRFYETLSLPSAAEDPDFWGPAYGP